MCVGWISPSSRLMLVVLSFILRWKKSVFDLLLWGVGGPHLAGVLLKGRDSITLFQVKGGGKCGANIVLAFEFCSRYACMLHLSAAGA